MDGIRTGSPRRLDEQVTAQVRLGGRVAGQGNRRVRLGDVRCVGVGVRVHGHGGDAEVAARAHHPPGDLAAIGHQHGADHRGLPSHD